VIPALPEEVTSSWLAEVLDVAVQDVSLTPVGTGQTGATYRITPTYSTDRRGLPDTFIVKLPSQDEAVRQRVAGGYRCEFAFYSEVAATVAAPLPHCFHCETDRDGFDFVLLMADLAPAVQGDQIKGCGSTEARLAVEALAGLHGPRWCDPSWLDFGGAMMPKLDAAAAQGIGELAIMAANTTIDKLGERMTDADRRTLTDAATLVSTWALLEPGRYSILHGDYRIDNLLFDPERTRVTVVDWQTMSVGLPARDVAYFAATSLLPDLRARTERDLVELYRSALQNYGVTGYEINTAWSDYRLGMLQVPLITTLGFAFSAATERGDDMVLAMLERGCRAIRELDTLDLIREMS
jgi:aminoglycoside phosphotransferase (APT) family kinase protein